METTLKCHYVKQLALYSLRYINGYKCDMQELLDDINVVKRFIWIEDNINECNLSGAIINDINKYKKSISKTYSDYCRGC